jgi:PKD repeat protein
MNERVSFRKLLPLTSLVFAVLLFACDTKTPSGPGSVTTTQAILTPTASFVASPIAATVGQQINVDGNASKAATGHTLATHSWNFGDGSTATGATSTHSYNASGTFVITLTVTDDASQKGTDSKQVTIAATGAASGTAQTTASFTVSPQVAAVGQQVQVDGGGSKAAAGHSIQSYSWNFGDGATKTGVTSSHDYDVAGAYTIVLTVTDDTGQKVTASNTVTITGTAPPTSASARYVGLQNQDPNLPADLSLFFDLVSGLTSSSFRRGPSFIHPLATQSFKVTGVFSTGTGKTGTINGTFVGTLTPAISGTFTGTMTDTASQCTRSFSGPTTDILQWTTTSPKCDGLPFDSVNTRKTDAPPTAPTPPTTPTPSTFKLSVAGNTQPWCTPPFTLTSNANLAGLGPVNTPGPFQTVTTALAASTSVTLTGSGNGTLTWTNCDTVNGSSCTVTMNSDRCGGCAAQPPTASISQACPIPAFTNVTASEQENAGNGGSTFSVRIEFTAVNLLPFGSTIIKETFTASCSAGTQSIQVNSVQSGTLTTSIVLPFDPFEGCGSGTLSVADFNGFSSTQWFVPIEFIAAKKASGRSR